MTESKNEMNELKVFTKTCNKSYDRHRYKINCIDGSSVIVDDYQQVIECYWEKPQLLKNVEVLDILTRGKGF